MITSKKRKLRAILFADMTERFAEGKFQGAKCTLKREGTEAPAEERAALNQYK